MTVPTDLRDRADAATCRRIAIEAIDALDESLEHTELVTALRTRLASANVPEPQEWIEYDRSAVLDDGPILVYLAADLLQSRIHTARVVRGRVLIVASVFYYDAPPITHWRPMLGGPAATLDVKQA